MRPDVSYWRMCLFKGILKQCERCRQLRDSACRLSNNPFVQNHFVLGVKRAGNRRASGLGQAEFYL